MSDSSFIKPGIYDVRNPECCPSRDGFLEFLNVARHTEIEPFEKTAYAVYRLISEEGVSSPILTLPWELFAFRRLPLLNAFKSINSNAPKMPPLEWHNANIPALCRFQRHYKHDYSKGPLEYDPLDYAYEVLGVVRTEDSKPEEKDHDFVVYRPLYEKARVFQAGKQWDLRPLEMFLGSVVSAQKPNGDFYTGYRFNAVEEAATKDLFQEQTEKLYGK